MYGGLLCVYKCYGWMDGWMDVMFRIYGFMSVCCYICIYSRFEYANSATAINYDLLLTLINRVGYVLSSKLGCN